MQNRIDTEDLLRIARQEDLDDIVCTMRDEYGYEIFDAPRKSPFWHSMECTRTLSELYTRLSSALRKNKKHLVRNGQNRYAAKELKH